MSQWNSSFNDVLNSLETDTATAGEMNSYQRMLGLFHLFTLSWQYEDGCLVWITSVPGSNIFGADVVFVNQKVLQELQWSFAEWESGIASSGVLTAEDSERFRLHLNAKSCLPIQIHLRKKTTPGPQTGNDYILHILYDVPHNLRVTVGVPL